LSFRHECLYEGLSVSPVAGHSVESRRKADDMMMVCSMKEMTGDLHAALLCCNQAACTSVIVLLLIVISKLQLFCYVLFG